MLQELGLRFKKLKLSPDLLKPAALIASYGAWILLLRLLFLSFLVYFLTRQGHRASFEEINEAFAANELPFIGIASATFVFLVKGFAPLIDRAGHLKIPAGQWRNGYLPGLLRGTLLGASLVAAFIGIGSIRYVGFFVQIEDAPVAIFSILLRVFALLAIGYCDELVFRSWKTPLTGMGGLTQVGVVALGFCVVKMAQFELSWMHFATLLLLSAALSVRRLSQESFLNGAGFWSALLIVFHPLCSLPIFGSDFSGIFLLKYRSLAALPAWVSGGVGGPLSSVGLQAVLLIELVRGFLVQRSADRAAAKKALLKLSTSQ